jgi:CHAT domain-containing protein/tetratricopeptide (TPR) repeat protein
MKRPITFVVLAAAAALCACEPDNRPAVSLEQAKQITAQFQGKGFTPPPRTIADITAILDQQKPDPAKAEATRKAADAEVPAGLQGLALAKFYFDRGTAAGDIGRINQRVDDIRKAVEIARPTRNIALGMYLAQLAIAELRAGQTKLSLATRQEHIQFIQSGSEATGQLIHSYAMMASIYSAMGDLDSANAWLTRADRLLADSKGWGRGTVYLIWGSDWEAALERGRAFLAENTGRFADAERSFRRALSLITESEKGYTQRAATGNAPPPGTYETLKYITTAALARAVLSQGRVVEAEVEARKALIGQLQIRGRYASETAEALGTMTMVLTEQGRHSEAVKLAEAAVDIYEKIGHKADSTRLAQTRLAMARAQDAVGRSDDALATYEKVGRDLSGQGDLYNLMLGRNVEYAMAILRSDKTDEAIAILREAGAFNTRTFGERHYKTAETRGFLGVALALKGDTAAAAEEFKSAATILLSPSRAVDEEEGGSAGRDGRLQRILESYIGVLARQRTPESAAESFRFADAIRGQSVQRALAASSARASASDPALAELVRQEQDAQKQVSSLQGVLTDVMASPPDQQDQTALRTLRSQIDTLRGARAKVREEIERRFPDYVNLIDPRPATVEQARKDLRPGEALIATYVGREQTFVWAVPQSGAIAFAAVPTTRGEMGRMVADLRKALDPNAATLGDIPAFDVALANKLYAALLQPVKAGWKDAKSLLVVPHGSLGQLPFLVLVTAPTTVPADREGQALFASYKSVPFLAKTAAITQLPSVASLGSLRALPPPRGERQAFIGFGDPWFSPQQAAEAVRETHVAQLQTRGARTLMQTRGVPLVRRNAPATQNVDSAELAQLPRLPDTADEVRSIALALNADPTKDVFTGREANERRVRSMDISNRKVVMFATHGLVPGDLNGLTQPALALSAPNVADIDGDGLLTLDEVLALKLNADWVVLSACNTAAGDGAGAEAVSGLGRAFFYAGTRALLVSNWPVETTSARELTTDLFRRQAQNSMLSRAEAMRQAMVGLIDGPGYVDPESRQAVFSYAHPIFWAPFSLVGDGGGGQPGG